MTTIKFDPVKILVVGDLMLDEYIFGKVERISPEAPVPVVWESYTHFTLGGAANVVNNLISLGVDVFVAGLVGDDENGYRLLTILEKDLGVDVGAIKIDFGRPTTTKTRIISGNQQLIRIDKEVREDINDDLKKLILEDLDFEKFDAMILSDYAKGVLTKEFVKELINRMPDKFIAVDPTGKDYSKYSGATLITPNEKEVELATGLSMKDDEVFKTAGELLSCYVNNVLITRGKDGMTLFEKGKKAFHIPTKAQEVFDVSGAGDTVIAVFTLAAANGYNLKTAAQIANAAAAAAVSKMGTAVVTMEEIGAKLKEIKRC